MSDKPKVKCSICQGFFKAAGLANHQRACQRKAAAREMDANFNAQQVLGTAIEILQTEMGETTESVREEPQASGSNRGLSPAQDLTPPTLSTPLSPPPLSPHFPVVPPLPSSPHVQYDAHVDTSDIVADDIKCVYHPSSGRDPVISHFEDYGQQLAGGIDHLIDPEPWRPFRTRRDFEFTSIAIEETMNKSSINQMLDLTFGATGKNPSWGPLTLESYDEMVDICKLASGKLPGFTKTQITVPFDDKEVPFDVWKRPIWDWIMKVVQDPRLAPHFEWDAKQLFKFDGETQDWVRFYEEPMSGDLCWKIQTTLPNGGKPLILILYADKTRLSMFGQAKGYPVILRIANLPAHIRNGDGLGGGVMVGWLPVIEEEAKHTHKPKWVRFKATVYHLAMEVILEDVIKHSHTGYTVVCGDGIQRLLYPSIPIKSTDYEEEYILSLAPFYHFG
ncbi:hypothetical protein ONZ45_g18001 [Pleurotus djamor]|nr:hypothetical protein ONZ45_g18001 [Pleurotus djamor]